MPRKITQAPSRSNKVKARGPLVSRPSVMSHVRLDHLMLNHWEWKH